MSPATAGRKPARERPLNEHEQDLVKMFVDRLPDLAKQVLQDALGEGEDEDGNVIKVDVAPQLKQHSRTTVLDFIRRAGVTEGGEGFITNDEIVRMIADAIKLRDAEPPLPLEFEEGEELSDGARVEPGPPRAAGTA